MSLPTVTLQALAISTAFAAAGGIATLSIFDIQEMKALPASRALPSIRWLFSRGSHIFPTAAFVSSASFAAVAVRAFSARSPDQPLLDILRVASNGSSINGYLAAAVFTISIAPWTTIVMIPTNFEIIKMNEDRGGTRSQNSAEGAGPAAGGRSALESVGGKGEEAEFTDLSGPQTRTKQDTLPGDDEKLQALLEKFSQLNLVRAVLMAAGGFAGLLAALV